MLRGPTRNRHGWLLCSDGARPAVAITWSTCCRVNPSAPNDSSISPVPRSSCLGSAVGSGRCGCPGTGERPEPRGRTDGCPPGDQVRGCGGRWEAAVASEDSGAHPRAMSQVLSGLRLDELLREVQDRLSEVMKTRDRMQRLLDAFLVVAEDLDLDTTLRRLVEAAVDLVDARYGALGVLGAGGGLSRFLHVGVEEDTLALMGHLPEGKGLLGQLILDPRPLRLDDL